MANSSRQRERFMAMLGEGRERLILLAVVSVLALSGIVLQGLVWWYGAQMIGAELAIARIWVWAVAAGTLILTVGILMTLLWRRLREA